MDWDLRKMIWDAQMGYSGSGLRIVGCWWAGFGSIVLRIGWAWVGGEMTSERRSERLRKSDLRSERWGRIRSRVRSKDHPRLAIRSRRQPEAVFNLGRREAGGDHTHTRGSSILDPWKAVLVFHGLSPFNATDAPWSDTPCVHGSLVPSANTLVHPIKYLLNALFHIHKSRITDTI